MCKQKFPLFSIVFLNTLLKSPVGNSAHLVVTILINTYHRKKGDDTILPCFAVFYWNPLSQFLTTDAAQVWSYQWHGQGRVWLWGGNCPNFSKIGKKCNWDCVHTMAVNFENGENVTVAKFELAFTRCRNNWKTVGNLTAKNSLQDFDAKEMYLQPKNRSATSHKRRKMFCFHHFQFFIWCRFQNVLFRIPFSKSTIFKICRQKMCRFRVNRRPIRHIFHCFQNVPASCERSPRNAIKMAGFTFLPSPKFLSVSCCWISTIFNKPTCWPYYFPCQQM